MNSCPTLLSIPTYDYMLVKLWMQSTHSAGQRREIESRKRLLQRSNTQQKHNCQLGYRPLAVASTDSTIMHAT
jgi:hypothetical protein